MAWFSCICETQLDESTQANQQPRDPSTDGVPYGHPPTEPQGDGFFQPIVQPIESEPTLQIGYHPDKIATVAVAACAKREQLHVRMNCVTTIAKSNLHLYVSKPSFLLQISVVYPSLKFVCC
ncbi:hypothetical protein ZIOFF_065065 [Zingiber officinale]|uniref:Uncharacterized protein n=1 Tax=Zingiber officinale TaxID=94328 RepID=A0A8J5EY82_ZINOF|nr:hypothetical protein ZIOFF_065065 [Zingiber officinale]